MEEAEEEWMLQLSEHHTGQGSVAGGHPKAQGGWNGPSYMVLHHYTVP